MVSSHLEYALNVVVLWLADQRRQYVHNMRIMFDHLTRRTFTIYHDNLDNEDLPGMVGVYFEDHYQRGPVWRKELQRRFKDSIDIVNMANNHSRIGDGNNNRRLYGPGF